MELMEGLGRRVKKSGRVYFTGGTTAVLMGWRDTTIDVDMKPEPETDEIFQAIATLKDELSLNIELASPVDFIPPLPKWQERCLFIKNQGPLHFFHYDLYAQALSKVERGHAQDQIDVETMLSRNLIDPKTLLQLFEAIRPNLIRYPAINAEAFEAKVREAVQHAR